MSKKNKQSKAIINDTKFATVLPGMLRSAKTLIERGDSELEKRDPKSLYPGTMIAATIISAQCAELLLKYKIEREGHCIGNTHDLYDLYKTLAEESKKAIEKEFAEQTSKIAPPDGWNTAESVFRKARNALVDWRYSVESTTEPPLLYFHALYTAAASVYKTIPILGLGVSRKEVVDPELKAELLAKTTNG
jgi:HEPN domain-containing protein